MGTDGLDTFIRAYAVDHDLNAPQADVATEVEAVDDRKISDAVTDLLSRVGGMSFHGGLYRTHRLDRTQAWANTVAGAWSEVAGKVAFFGYDWLGRQFGLYKDNEVLQFSAGDLEFVRIPADLATFHNVELVDYADDALARPFYKAWLDAGGKRPSYSECIGYKKPLFLGGKDWLENLECTDLDVYWTVSAPVIAKARGAGAGGQIGRFEIG